MGLTVKKARVQFQRESADPMSEMNPYESPKAASYATTRKTVEKMPRAAAEALRIVAVSAIVGTILCISACCVLSGGHAAASFYLIYGCFGAVIGIAGGTVAGLVIMLMRAADRLIAGSARTRPSNANDRGPP